MCRGFLQLLGKRRETEFIWHDIVIKMAKGTWTTKTCFFLNYEDLSVIMGKAGKKHCVTSFPSFCLHARH